MNLSYKIGTNVLQRKTTGFSFLTNYAGSYYSGDTKSRYGGFYIFEDDMYQIFHKIELEKVDEIVNEYYQTHHKRQGTKETIFIPKNFNSILIKYSQKKNLVIYFDIKKSYDNSEFEREYVIENKGEYTELTYHKDGKYTIYIITNAKLSEGKWVETKYPTDSKRNDPPYSRYHYKLTTDKLDKLIISSSTKRGRAIKEFQELKNDEAILINKQKEHFSKFKGNIQQITAKNSLEMLKVKNKLFAGLPWFFQEWTRDELISVKGIEEKMSKEIIFRLSKEIQKDGRIPNRINLSGLKSADGIGWLWKRTGELEWNITDKKILGQRIEQSLLCLMQFHTKNGLAYNAPLETWMDTAPENEFKREGVNIEIQALRLTSYKTAYKLTGKKIYADLEQKMKKKVLQLFWDGKKLKDNLNSDLIRPNVFLAAYIYPELLNKEEWSKCFSFLLSNLWLSWGGISSIQKDYPAFQWEHTGHNNKSYHFGDSWYWINNIAAIMMNRTNAAMFKDYIEKIKEASIKEMMWSGASGCCAEISSAKKMQSEGCILQAWSASTLLELLEELG